MGETRAVRRPVRRPADNNDDQHYQADPDEAPDAGAPRRSATRPTRREVPTPRDDAPRGRRERQGGDGDDDDQQSGKRAELRGGWGGWKEERDAAGGWADEFKVDYGKVYLIKICSDSPVVTYRLHWIDELDGKKSWTCPRSAPEQRDEPCGFCDDLGDKPSAKAVFDVIEFVESKQGDKTFMDPVMKVWDIGSGVVSILEDLAEDTKHGGLVGPYWKVRKTKQGGRGKRGGATTYHIDSVKERDLLDDWGIEPLTEDELAELEEKKKAHEYVTIPTPKRIHDLTAEVMDEG